MLQVLCLSFLLFFPFLLRRLLLFYSRSRDSITNFVCLAVCWSVHNTFFSNYRWFLHQCRRLNVWIAYFCLSIHPGIWIGHNVELWYFCATLRPFPSRKTNCRRLFVWFYVFNLFINIMKSRFSNMKFWLDQREICFTSFPASTVRVARILYLPWNQRQVF